MKRTAAVIVTYNRKDLLLECVSAVLAQKGGAPAVIVVDNDSGDGTGEALRPYVERGEVIYFNTGANLGGAGGFQYGIRKAVEMGYEYLWIMDDDCIPSETALSALLSAAREKPEFGFLSSKVLWKDGSICRMNVQREKLTKNVTHFGRKRIPVVMASFVSLFLRADVVREAGLPIKEFFIWTDDWEFTRRISRSRPCWLVTDSVVTHKSKANIAADISRETADRLDRFRYLYRNDVVLYRREGLRGFAYECVRLSGHCVRVLLKAKDHKMKRLGKILGGTLEGLSFRPGIEYADQELRVLEAFGEPIADGGQEAFVFNTLEKMDRTGMRIDFLTAYDLTSRHYAGMAEQMGGKIYALKLPFAPGKSRNNIAAPFRAFLRTHSYDVVHVHSGSISVLALMSSVAKRAGVKKVIVHSHATGEKDSLKHRILRFAASLIMAGHVDLYCACSQKAAEWKFEPKYAARAKIIKNGIDTRRFRCDPGTRERMRRMMGLEASFVIGHVGRFTKEKNHRFLVEIFELLLERCPEARLLLVGAGDGMERVRKQVREKALEDKVLFSGSVTNVEDYLQVMDVFVLPSLFEGLGIAAVEAQSTGLPVVLSDSVTREAKIAENAVYLSLNDSPAVWADTILGFRGCQRKGQSDLVRDAGFDICRTAAVVRRIYMERN